MSRPRAGAARPQGTDARRRRRRTNHAERHLRRPLPCRPAPLAGHLGALRLGRPSNRSSRGCPDAALSPWNGGTYASWRETPREGLSVSRWGYASWGASVVLFAILSLVGIAVRRRLPHSLRQRPLALFAASLTVAVVTALSAALLRYNTPAKSPPGGGSGYYTPVTHHYHGAPSYFVSSLLLTLLLGVFAFDVAGLLREPRASALRRAGGVVGVAFLAFGLLFPPSWSLTDCRQPTSARISDAPAPTPRRWGALPYHWLSRRRSRSRSGCPRHGSTTTARAIRPWPLAEPCHSHGDRSSERKLSEFAASLGAWGSLVGIAITAAVLAALAWATIGLCRLASAWSVARRACFRLGVLEGACVSLLVAAATVVTTFSYRITWGSAPKVASSQPADVWRTTPLGLACTVVILIGFCAVTGLGYALIMRKRAGTRGEEAWAEETATPTLPR